MHRALLIILPLLILSALIYHSVTQPPIGCCPIANPEALRDTYDPSLTTGVFHGKTVFVPSLEQSLASSVLGESAGNKRIEVNLGAQHVSAYEGDTRVFDFVVSTGKWAPTPGGEFTIQRKVRSQLMAGGNKALGTYYYLPNVPWVMFFGNGAIPWNRGFSFHGTYWHNNFGQPMSHGCINMKIPDAEALFHWAPEGTPVQIF